jgi:nitrate/nitrite-specific signal transduction histidine kinase
MTKALNWIIKQHWWLIGLVAFVLVSLEIFEATRKQDSPIHIIELLIFLLLLLVVGVLFDLLSQSMKRQNQTMKILDFKHKLSHEFSEYTDWDMLISQLARLPGTLASVDQTHLFLLNPISNQFESLSHWNEDGERQETAFIFEMCQNCIMKKTNSDSRFSKCAIDKSIDGTAAQVNRYCLPIRFGDGQLMTVQFNLKLGEDLNKEQDEIFRNISDEIAVALTTSLNRKTFFEMQSSETALAERRTVSHYLHDNLGQNLGYLCFKLDQLIIENDQLSRENLISDLTTMREAANDSYEIVRGTLETIQMETTPQLTNLLIEHARKVAKRANFELNFETKGTPYPVAPNVQRAVFYIFKESLNNVEKHAKASKVHVLTEWDEENLAVTISDNGSGFDRESVDSDRHFGLEIMNERIAKVNGQLKLTASENSGTSVNISVPHSLS